MNGDEVMSSTSTVVFIILSGFILILYSATEATPFAVVSIWILLAGILASLKER